MTESGSFITFYIIFSVVLEHVSPCWLCFSLSASCLPLWQRPRNVRLCGKTRKLYLTGISTAGQAGGQCQGVSGPPKQTAPWPGGLERDQTWVQSKWMIKAGVGGTPRLVSPRARERTVTGCTCTHSHTTMQLSFAFSVSPVPQFRKCIARVGTRIAI